MSFTKAAKASDIPGIDGDYGAVFACGTCHVFVRSDWMKTTGSASGTELIMLEFHDDFDGD